MSPSSSSRLRSPRRRPAWPLSHALCLALAGGWTGYWKWTFVLGGFALPGAPDPWLNGSAGAVVTHPLPVWPVVVLMAMTGALTAPILIRRHGRQVIATVLACLLLAVLTIPAASLIVALAEAWSVKAAPGTAFAAAITGVAGGFLLAPALVLDPISIEISVVLGVVASMIADWLQPSGSAAASQPGAVRPGSSPSDGLASPPHPARRFKGRAIGLAVAGAALAYSVGTAPRQGFSAFPSESSHPIAALVFSHWSVMAATAVAGVQMARIIAREDGCRLVATIFACGVLTVWSAIITSTFDIYLDVIEKQFGLLGTLVSTVFGLAAGLQFAATLVVVPAIGVGCVVLGLGATALAMCLDGPSLGQSHVGSWRGPALRAWTRTE